MSQLYLTLDEELLQGLLSKNHEEAMRKLMEKIANALISQKAEEEIDAEAYARTGARTPYRNEYRDRAFTTRIGTITIRIPKFRDRPSQA